MENSSVSINHGKEDLYPRIALCDLGIEYNYEYVEPKSVSVNYD